MISDPDIWRAAQPLVKRHDACPRRNHRAVSSWFSKHISPEEETMESVSRRSALAVGLGVASALVVGNGTPAEAAVDEKMIAKGVVQRNLGEGPAMIPGYKKVSLRDFVVQPGASSPPNTAMKNPMVCHITKGELQVVQDGKEFVAKKNYVWTCNTGTVEYVLNKGKSEAIMRITDLLA